MKNAKALFIVSIFFILTTCSYFFPPVSLRNPFTLTASDINVDVTSDATSDIVTDGTPNVTPAVTPATTPGVTPDVTTGVTPSVTSDITVGVTPSITPDVTVGVTPSIAPDVIVGVTPSITPDVSVGVTPSITPDVTVGVTPSITPDATQVVTPGMTPDTGGAHVVYVSKGSVVEEGTIDKPFSRISDAINSLPDGGIIFVTRGFYMEDVTLPPTKTIELYGGFSSTFEVRDPGVNTTMISGTGSTAVISMVFTGDNSVTCHPVIDGFFVMDGNRGIDIINTGAGGLLYVTIANSYIQNNSGLTGETDYGGGIRLDGAIPVIDSNLITNNSCGQGGGIYVRIPEKHKQLVMTDNTIRENTALAGSGGGVYLAIYEGRVARNTIVNNTISAQNGRGGGLALSGYNYPLYDDTVYVELTKNTYAGNEILDAGGGVYITESANVRMNHELVYSNVCGGDVYSGAGVLIDTPHYGDAKVTLDHCTVYNNTGAVNVPGHGLAMMSGGYVEISNSIFYQNSNGIDSDFYQESSSSLLLNYNCWQGNISSTGTFNEMHSISGDPLFADPTNADFHLRSQGGWYDFNATMWVTDTQTSICIDAADPAADYSLETAPNGGRANLGVFGNTEHASRSF